MYGGGGGGGSVDQIPGSLDNSHDHSRLTWPQNIAADPIFEDLNFKTFLGEDRFGIPLHPFESSSLTFFIHPTII